MVRVEQGQVHPFTFHIEPFPYTRLNSNSRWSAGPGSAEFKYMAWKEQVGDLFRQYDFQESSKGMPWHEPLIFGGEFYVEQNFEGKDLDNLAKGLVDALNPKKRKDWKQLKTFLWLDDKQCLASSSWKKYQKAPGYTDFRVTPMWGRVDPMLNTLAGDLILDESASSTREWIVRSYYNGLEYDWPVTVTGGDNKTVFDLHDQIGKSELLATISFSVWPHLVKGRYPVFLHHWQAILVREFGKIPGLSIDTGFKVLHQPWDAVLEGLATGKSIHWTSAELGQGRAGTALSKIRESFQDPVKYLQDLKSRFDQEVFDRCSEEISQRFSMSWPSVRLLQKNVDVHWAKGLDHSVACISTHIEKTLRKK